MSARSREWELEFETASGLWLRAYIFAEHLHLGLYQQVSAYGCSGGFRLEQIFAREPSWGFHPDGRWTPFEGLYACDSHTLTTEESERVLSYCRAHEGLTDVSPRGPSSRRSSLAERLA